VVREVGGGCTGEKPGSERGDASGCEVQGRCFSLLDGRCCVSKVGGSLFSLIARADRGMLDGMWVVDGGYGMTSTAFLTSSFPAPQVLVAAY
jgi:hypothetical protein